VEEGNWQLDIYQACHYWDHQIQQTPFNLWACRSLVLLSSQIEDFSPFKEALRQCLETLNGRENLNFIIDLTQIFLKAKWEELLLQATNYLIDHEEYLLAGEILKDLLKSSNKSIRIHASKNDARRLIWLGQHAACIQAYSSILARCRSPSLFIPLKNDIGIAHYFSGNWEYAMQLFQENMSYKGKKDEREMGIAKYMAGMIMTYRGDNAMKAKELLDSCVQIFESTRSYLWTIAGLNGLGDFSYRLQQWFQALYYLNKSREIADALQNNTFRLYTLWGLARVYLRLFGARSPEITGIVEIIESLLEETLEVGHSWVTTWAQNTLATIYAHRGEQAKLQLIMQEIVPLTINYKQYYIFTLSNLGHLAAIQNQTFEAKKYYQEAYALAKEFNNQFAIQEIKQDFLGCALPTALQEGLEFV
jgi:tetratricopeptide (TPR) repeat protein